MLTPTLHQPSDLFKKMLREQHRAFHAAHEVHVADHVYNFCITAIALRDHMLISLGMERLEQEKFHQLWSEDPARVACREIANTAKHAVLKRGKPRTRAAILSTTSVANIYRRSDGSLVTRIEARPDFFVSLEDSTSVDLLQLTDAVISFWKEFYAQRSLPLEEQSESEFFGLRAPGPDSTPPSHPAG
jgi:hypothetical protein